MYMGVLIAFMSVYTICMVVRSRYQIPWNWSYRWRRWGLSSGHQNP